MLQNVWSWYWKVGKGNKFLIWEQQKNVPSGEQSKTFEDSILD